MPMPSYAEYKPDGSFATMDAVAACFEHRTQALLMDRPALPPEFFDLRTGLTGELVQKLTQYGIRLACVVPDLGAQPPRFQEFAREANRGGRTRFFEAKAEAVGWLEAG
ncbi:MAG TPA: DUF4180 domain-containing protein [Bacteroidetes bacterium]|nr:DUF4180 domain-containing protein [Bacteroidota bacterium]HIL57525.1 DUF4180 domain-containing protein [Rhodothermales bacterium]